jgi:hypothetical protein
MRTPWPTHVDGGAPVFDEVPDVVRSLDDRMLDVAPARIALTGEHGVHLDHPVGLEAAQLVLEQVVVLGGPATEEQH